MKTTKEINQIRRLRNLRTLHEGSTLQCKALDEQIERLETAVKS